VTVGTGTGVRVAVPGTAVLVAVDGAAVMVGGITGVEVAVLVAVAGAGVLVTVGVAVTTITCTVAVDVAVAVGAESPGSITANGPQPGRRTRLNTVRRVARVRVIGSPPGLSGDLPGRS
jgi:hypothetical protein